MAQILVIEDNIPNLDLMTYLLQAFGHVPHPAQDGAAGLAAARTQQFDLILCDVQLPGMDGYELARTLRRDPDWRPVPLVAVTALAMVGDRDRVLAAGFDGYLPKPIVPETFVAQVEAFLNPDQRPAPSSAAVDHTPVPAPEPLSASKNITILVIDNLPANLSLMRSIFEPFGYTVVTVQRATEALSLARQSPPDLIISDVHMPDLDGFDLIRLTKADQRLRDVPFIFISSSSWSGGGHATAMELGASRFIQRPIDPPVLLSEVEAVLQAARRPHLS